MSIFDEKDVISQKLAVSNSKGRFELNRNRDWGLVGHDIGIHDLNMGIGGLIPKKLTSIAARSGVGKTAITTQMFDAGTRILNNRRSEFLFFTWEMSPDYLVDRHICNKAGVTNNLLTQGAKLLKGSLLDRVNEAYEDSEYLPVTYQKASTDISRVRQLFEKFCDNVEKKRKVEGIDILPVFVIDYVGMAKFRGQGLRTYDIAEFMNSAKQIVNDCNASGVVMAQIGRGADDKDEPKRNDLSDSKTIEDASDNLIILHRPYHSGQLYMKDEDGQEVESRDRVIYKIEKSRDYGISRKISMCDIAKYRFWSTNHTYDFDYWSMYKDKEFWKSQFKIKVKDE